MCEIFAYKTYAYTIPPLFSLDLMMIRTLTRALAAASFVLSAMAPAAHATVLTTTDLTAVAGTSWAAIDTTPVRVDFGAGYGLGTITVTSINGGLLRVLDSAYTGEAYSAMALDANTTLNLTQELTFRLPGTPISPGLIGFNVSMTLDSGSFAAGSALIIRSLDSRADGIQQFFSPGDAFAASPYAAILPSDTVFNPAASGVLVNTGSDADGELWSSDRIGVAQGRAFALTDATDTFDFRVLATGSYGGGVAFSLALPAAAQIPEPESLALVLAALAICGGISVRRKTTHL